MSDHPKVHHDDPILKYIPCIMYAPDGSTVRAESWEEVYARENAGFAHRPDEAGNPKTLWPRPDSVDAPPSPEPTDEAALLTAEPPPLREDPPLAAFVCPICGKQYERKMHFVVHTRKCKP